MLRPLLLAAALALPVAAPAPIQAQGLAGPYLAARIAGFDDDFAAAAAYYDALIGRGERAAPILENAIVVYAALGDTTRAARTAALLEEGGDRSQFADGALLLDALTRGDWDAASALIEERSAAGALLDGLLTAWIAVARDDLAAADAALDGLSETRGFAQIAALHRAYIRAYSGDLVGADALLSGEEEGPLGMTARGVAAQAQVLAGLGRRDDALELLEQAAAVSTAPGLEALAARIEAGEEVAFELIRQPTDGMAEAYFMLAAVLLGETSPTFTLLSSRAATALRPDHVDALILTADLLSEQGRHELASEALQMVPRDDPSFFAAEIARAEALLAMEREEAAVEVLAALTRSTPDRREVWAAQGDTLRRLERWAEAATAYERALALVDDPAGRDWYLHYVLGIAYERSDRFDDAETEFRRALELNPDQPLVLNYLGYGLVEERRNLAEALDMIERAVAARPDDGYITDSLAWVLYRLGRYDEAIGPMERAVELEPLDPIINDHLGDVLWTVDRKREARFQWERALSLDPEPEDATRIRRKLEVGLDAVLEEEGGKGPLEAAAE
jgi:tetratricopeptide (TPR) repeat protein